MTEADVETIAQRSREAYPGHLTWIIYDYEPRQLITRDSKTFGARGPIGYHPCRA